jgi:hypothetical protein
MRTHTPRPTASTRGRRLSALGAAVTLALGGVAACDGAADSANDSTRPDTDPSSTEAGGDPSPIEADAALPEPMPLKGPISACDLLLPVEVGLYLAMDPPTVREEMLMGTSTCTYLSEGSPMLVTQLVPATLSLREQLDLAMLGMHPVERFDLHGQPAAAGSDGYGVTTLGVAVEERDSVFSVAASDYADGMLPGTDELAVPGDQRVMDAQRDAAEELVEIALVRLGVSEG